MTDQTLYTQEGAMTLELVLQLLTTIKQLQRRIKELERSVNYEAQRGREYIVHEMGQ